MQSVHYPWCRENDEKLKILRRFSKQTEKCSRGLLYEACIHFIILGFLFVVKINPFQIGPVMFRGSVPLLAAERN